MFGADLSDHQLMFSTGAGGGHKVSQSGAYVFSPHELGSGGVDLCNRPCIMENLPALQSLNLIRRAGRAERIIAHAEELGSTECVLKVLLFMGSVMMERGIVAFVQ